MLPTALLSNRGGPRDDAVSPVIAVILMVAITVVLAATVYVWVSGFTDTGDQAPSANFRFVACDPGTSSDKSSVGFNNLTLKLTSGGPLQLDDTKLVIFNKTNDAQEATADPINSSGGQWSTGTQKKFSDAGSADSEWDSALTNGFEDGSPYQADFVHKPTESTYSSLPWTC